MARVYTATFTFTGDPAHLAPGTPARFEESGVFDTREFAVQRAKERRPSREWRVSVRQH
jgi:hypothetical protein